jgi:peptidoglycan/xylan/chitin deacetylase (PgdA/CDA1 family)
MSLLHTARFSSWIRGHLVCRVEDVPDRFALTFDDGPSAETTPRVLDLLTRHRARATFFLLAGNMELRPALVQRLFAEGHEPALHGDLHLPLPLLSRGLLRREIERSVTALEGACGARARYFRPPFGLMMPWQAAFVRDLGSTSVLGDVYPEDAHRPGIRRIVDRVMPRLRQGSILILHDGSPLGSQDRSQTVDALETILTKTAQVGLRAVTVGELLAGRCQATDHQADLSETLPA